jgi:hypothetical protein
MRRFSPCRDLLTRAADPPPPVAAHGLPTAQAVPTSTAMTRSAVAPHRWERAAHTVVGVSFGAAAIGNLIGFLPRAAIAALLLTRRHVAFGWGLATGWLLGLIPAVGWPYWTPNLVAGIGLALLWHRSLHPQRWAS